MSNVPNLDSTDAELDELYGGDAPFDVVFDDDGEVLVGPTIDELLDGHSPR